MELESIELKQLLEGSYPLSEKAMEDCRDHWNSVAKPLHSLGIFEKLLIQIAGITGKSDIDIKKKAVVVLCSDNGVVKEGVTQTDEKVTAAVAAHIAAGKGNINTLADYTGARVLAVDMGMVGEVEEESLYRCKITKGTGNIAVGPAMTKEQAVGAILTGIDIIKRLKEEGITLVGTGEMGIGNTTTSTAMASVLLNRPPRELTGPGAGLTPEGVERKIQVIEKAISVNQVNREDPLDILAKLGGYDIAGMTGLFLGGMMYRVPIVIDGVISAVSALTACRLKSEAVHYMLASHMGREKACGYLMEELSLTPVIHGDLALGEGSGTALLFPLLDMAERVYRNSPSFLGMQIKPYEELDKSQTKELIKSQAQELIKSHSKGLKEEEC